MNIVQRVKEMADEFASSLNLFIEEVEWVKEQQNNVLRVIADSKTGLTIDDAQALSKALSQALDEEDFIDCEYLLEVSSPGLEKELKNDEQIKNAIGDYINIKLYSSIDKIKELEGTLISFENDIVEIEVNKKIYNIEKEKISKIRKAIKF